MHIPSMNWPRPHRAGRRIMAGLIMVAALVIAVSCTEEPNPTPLPPTNTIAPTPTAPLPTPVPIPTPTPTPTPVPRDISQWTAENPATFEEIELALEKYRGENLKIGSWGGAYEEAQRQAYFLPFQENFGIKIELIDPNVFWRSVPLGRKRPTLHVFDVSTRSANHLGIEGDLEELTPAIHNGYLSGFPEVARTPWSGGGGTIWSTGLAYNLNAIDDLWGGQRPTSWADFWDVERFPGRRGMFDRIHESIFFAQFALNPGLLNESESRLAIARLTDQQVNQSFEKMEEIKPHIDEWIWGWECIRMLLGSELDICTTWSNRIWDAQQEMGGESFYYCYECGHVNQTDVFAIPKCAPNKTLAELFIAWTGHPHINVRMSNYIPYGPLNTNALLLLQHTLSAESIAALPTSPQALERAVLIDEKWLASVEDTLIKRFEDFLADVNH